MALNQLEAAKILSIFEAAYPAYYVKQTQESKKMAVFLMADLFADKDYALVSMAARRAIAEDTPYPPSLGHMIALCDGLKRSISMAIIEADAVKEPLPTVQQYIIREASREKQKILNMLSQGGNKIESNSRI